MTTIDAPRLVHLTESDLNTKIDHTPRVMDLRLADELGFERAAKIRDLIDRHADALRQLGPLPTTIEKPSHRGGRPGTAYWLNKQQALYLCTKSETARATEATLLMVKVFDAYLDGKPAPPKAKSVEPPAPQRPNKVEDTVTKATIRIATGGAPDRSALAQAITKASTPAELYQAAADIARLADGSSVGRGLEFHRIDNRNMEPRFRLGDIVVIRPGTGFRYDGDYVVEEAGGRYVVQAQSWGSGKLLIKQLHAMNTPYETSRETFNRMCVGIIVYAGHVMDEVLLRQGIER